MADTNPPGLTSEKISDPAIVGWEIWEVDIDQPYGRRYIYGYRRFVDCQDALGADPEAIDRRLVYAVTTHRWGTLDNERIKFGIPARYVHAWTTEEE